MEETYGYITMEELEKLITGLQDQLFRFAFFRTGSLADSQDIVQDIFVKLYKQQKLPTNIQNVKHYLLRSIANACIDYHRRKKQSFESVDNITDSAILQDKDASYHLMMMEDYERIERTLLNIPTEQAETIRLRVLDNLSFVEISELLEEPVTTIKSRFKYGMDKLKLIVHAKKDVYEL